MAVGQRPIKLGGDTDLRGAIRIDSWLDTIRYQGLEATKVLPIPERGRAFYKVGQIGLMVAFEKNPLICTVVHHQPFDNLLRRGSAVDVIAKKNCDRMMVWICRHVCFNAIEEVRKQVGSAVDITNRINTDSIRHTWPRLLLKR